MSAHHRKRRLPVVAASDAGLPELHARWVASLLGRPIPSEPLATCDDCAMLTPGAQTRAFLPDTKCCSYEPRLPNFLVGRILADHAGRALLGERLARRVGVTPLGIRPPLSFQRLYEPGHGVLGRSRALRCPYYLDEHGGRCGLWRHRNGVCATWFCKHERGAVARRFWQTLEQLFSEAEIAIASWCVLEAEIGAGALRELFPHPKAAPASLDGDEIDGRVDEAVYRRLWGHWAGREEAFYAKAAELAGALDWSEVLRLGSPRLAVLARMTMDAFEALMDERAAPRLRAAPVQMEPLDGAHSRLTTYSSYDPIELPNELVAALAEFDGGSTARTLRRIERRHGLALDAALIRRLVDFEVLVETEAR